ncbi:DKNYY domain-containing protein [Flavobacterium amniphilum]|uniref:DKNYY domain-containing protein n=1 Tax=Flavobacterium amniphilum TaxID=1834035 RepID=UPI002029ED73|nr:DKNYY domain-containing protein [Flavobacterium amniphilum]MCL9804204.1 DKNYY domain-containing protein [Flavobacterium amniphilum]
MKNISLIILLFLVSLTVLGQTTEKHYSSCGSKENRCACVVEYALKDSVQLTHIKNQFYRSSSGHLYEKTDAATRDGKDFIAYFAGCISQEVDPFSFVELDGWFAKDRNNVYYFRPVSGGMQIVKLEKADTKTFRIFEGIYILGIDKNYLYNETDIVKEIDVRNYKVCKNETDDGRTVKITSGKETVEFTY